jgi:hypothetical protein
LGAGPQEKSSYQDRMLDANVEHEGDYLYTYQESVHAVVIMIMLLSRSAPISLPHEEEMVEKSGAGMMSCTLKITVHKFVHDPWRLLP